MRPYPRSERVASRIQVIIADLIRKKVRDPRLSLVTISSVRVTSDLKIAYVYFSVFGDEKRILEAAQGLESSHGFLKREVAPKLGVRYMPELKFIHDESFDHGSRMDQLIKSVLTDNDPEQ